MSDHPAAARLPSWASSDSVTDPEGRNSMAQETQAKTESPTSVGHPESSAPSRVGDDTSQGKTTIASSVVQKIAGMATKEISGVHSLGGGISKA
ncbi:MAG: hypothetical protein ACRDTS_18010, partial [Mycobacterium sp.]